MHRTWTNNGKFTYTKSFRNLKNSKTKSFQYNETHTIPCPIKSTKSIIPKDLHLQKIFTTMLSSSNELSSIYSNLVSKVNIDINSRKKIFKKIREFFISNLVEYKIYFKTILLFDIISIECEKNKLLNTIEEIALGALILSVKFNYDENKMFSMKKFLKFYCDKVYTLNDIIEIERKALKTINYFLNYTTPMCFLEFFILNGIIYNIDNLNENEYHKIYSKTENVLEKIMEESNNYLKYNFFYLACSVVSYCRQIFHLEKWPFMLKNVFSIDFCIFQNEYNIYFSFKEKEKVSDKEIKTYINKKNSYNCTTYNCHTNKDIIINGNNNVVLLDLKSLNNSDRVTEEEKGYKNNNFNIYKKNNFKTINHYNNNIINININNVSVNSINNLYNSKTNKNINSNRFHYNSSNSTINDYSNKNNIKRSINIYEGIYKKSISKNKYKNRYKNKDDKNIKSTKNLAAIKEVKDYIDLKPYISPNKRKRKHYYINRIETSDKDNIKLNINETKKSENYNIIEEDNEGSMNNKSNNIFKDRKILSNYNNIIHFDSKIKNSNEKKDRQYLYENKNNNNSNENSSNNISEGKIDNINIKYSSNINIKEYNSNNSNNIYKYDENKNESNIIKNKYRKNISDTEKIKKILNYKCESSRIGQSYIKNKNMGNELLYTEDKEKYNKINNETEVKRNIDYKNINDFKEKEKEIKNKRIKIENKIKYNDLIKYKLAMSSYSINKRK